jgi:hypothetical protein
MIYLLSGSRRANGFGLALRNWHTKSRTAQFDAFVRTYEGWRWNVRAESQIYDRRSATGRRRAQAVGKRYRSAGSTTTSGSKSAAVCSWRSVGVSRGLCGAGSGRWRRVQKLGVRPGAAIHSGNGRAILVLVDAETLDLGFQCRRRNSETSRRTYRSEHATVALLECVLDQPPLTGFDRLTQTR